jgi:hypothetical protein
MVSPLNPIFWIVNKASKAVVAVAGGLLGIGGGKAATTPATPDPPVVPPTIEPPVDPTPLDPIIQPITDIVGSMSDATLLILAGVAILAVYGAITLIRGRS